MSNVELKGSIRLIRNRFVVFSVCLILGVIVGPFGLPRSAWAISLNSPVSVSASALSYSNSPTHPESNALQIALRGMIPADIRSRIYQARDSWMKGDGKAFAALFAPDGEFVVPGNRWVGRDAIQNTANEFASGHTGVEIRALHNEGMN